MFNVECAECKNNINNNDDAYIYNSKIFCDKDCLYDYLAGKSLVSHIRITDAED